MYLPFIIPEKKKKNIKKILGNKLKVFDKIICTIIILLLIIETYHFIIFIILLLYIF